MGPFEARVLISGPGSPQPTFFSSPSARSVSSALISTSLGIDLDQCQSCNENYFSPDLCTFCLVSQHEDLSQRTCFPHFPPIQLPLSNVLDSSTLPHLPPAAPLSCLFLESSPWLRILGITLLVQQQPHVCLCKPSCWIMVFWVIKELLCYQSP